MNGGAGAIERVAGRPRVTVSGVPKCSTSTMTVEPEHRVTVVLNVRPMLRDSEKVVVESVLGRLQGVIDVDANPVAQTATVRYDRAAVSLAELRRAVQDCGYHCTGQSVPGHVCNPRAEPEQAAEHPRVR